MNKINNNLKEQRFFQVAVKSRQKEGETIKLKWYASTNDEDRYEDIVEPEAFKSSVNRFLQTGVILLQHKHDIILWKPLTATIDGKWLYIEVELSNDYKGEWQEKSVFQLIEAWILNGFSIWFIPSAADYTEDNGEYTRIIKDLDLVEVSIVSIPANPNAIFTLTKSLNKYIRDSKNIFEKNAEIIDWDMIEYEDEIPEVIVEAEGWNNATDILPEKSDENLDNSEKTIGEQKSNELSNKMDEKSFEKINKELEQKFLDKYSEIEKSFDDKLSQKLLEMQKSFNDEVNQTCEALIKSVMWLKTRFDEVDNRIANNYKWVNAIIPKSEKVFSAKNFYEEVMATKN